MRTRAAAVFLAAAALVAPAGRAGAAQPSPLVHPETPVTAVDMRAGFAHNSPLLVSDPSSPEVMLAASRLDGPDFGCALHVSGDGGRSWLPAPLPDLPRGAEKCYAPEVAFEAGGRAHLLFLGLHGRGNSPMGAFLASTGRAGFGPARQVLGPERYMVRMAVDQRTGRIHLVWLEATSDPPLGGLPAGPNPLMSAFSDDGGRTFSRPVQVNDPARERVVAPALAVAPDGTVHVAYYDLRDDIRDYQGLEGPVWEGQWSLVVSSSDDGGATFARHQLVDDGLVPPERVMLIFTMPPPALAVDGDGRVYTAWHDARNGDWDAFAAASADGARTWSAPVRLHDDAVGNGAHQYLPRLAVASTGRVDAVFYDRRNDPDNLRHDVWYTSSTDDGATFAPNLSLTAESSDFGVGPRYAVTSARGLVELGSRLALVSLPDRTVAAWTDTRNSLADSDQQDVFATTIELAPGDAAETLKRPPRWWWLGGGTLLVALVAAIPVVWWARHRSDHR